MKVINKTVYSTDSLCRVWLRKQNTNKELICDDKLLRTFNFLGKTVYIYFTPFQYNKKLVQFLAIRGWYILYCENYLGKIPVLNLFDNTQRLFNDTYNYRYGFYKKEINLINKDNIVSIEDAHKQWINNPEYKKLLTVYNISLITLLKFMFSKKQYLEI